MVVFKSSKCVRRYKRSRRFMIRKYLMVLLYNLEVPYGNVLRCNKKIGYAQVQTQPQRAYWYNVDTDETVWDDPHSNDQPEHVAASKALQQFSVPLAPRGTTPLQPREVLPPCPLPREVLPPFWPKLSGTRP